MTKKKGGFSRQPILQDRIRRIDPGGFAFVPNRFLHEGYFANLTSDERSLYFLLVLAGDRSGISYYHYDSICSTIETPIETYLVARNGLIKKDLIAFDGTRYQVLSLPDKPVITAATPLSNDKDFERADRATIRTQILHALSTDSDD